MANNKADLLQGTLDLLILKSLQNEPMHGFGIAVRIGQLSNDMLMVEQGSLYPAVYRLEGQGWIKAEWGISENNRKAKFYSLTGRRPEAVAGGGAGLGESLDGHQSRPAECMSRQQSSAG